MLETLEKGQQGGALSRLADDLPLFSAAARRPSPAPATAALAEPAAPSPVETALAEVQPDELTPRQALDIVYRLKNLAVGTG